jgi:trans-aconitate 2-methyltransferase
MPDWNAAQYLRFSDERTRACRDLAARVPGSPRSIVDLGCGPGNSTAVLAERWPDAAITGIDTSEDMLAAALRDYPAVEWCQADISEWAYEDGPAFDLVFSNAALQWIPDHGALFPRLLARADLLAIQIPASSGEPAQRAIRDLAAAAPWRPRFRESIADWQTHDAGFYYDILAPVAARIDLWYTDYLHVMDGPEAIVEWYRGTALRPFLNALPPQDRDAFVAEYLDAIRPAYPPRPDGRVLFPFRRLFLLVRRR